MSGTKRDCVCALIAALKTKPSTVQELIVLSGFTTEVAVREWLADLQAANHAEPVGTADRDGPGLKPLLWRWRP